MRPKFVNLLYRKFYTLLLSWSWAFLFDYDLSKSGPNDLKPSKCRSQNWKVLPTKNLRFDHLQKVLNWAAFFSVPLTPQTHHSVSQRTAQKRTQVRNVDIGTRSLAPSQRAAFIIILFLWNSRGCSLDNDSYWNNFLVPARCGALDILIGWRYRRLSIYFYLLLHLGGATE